MAGSSMKYVALSAHGAGGADGLAVIETDLYSGANRKKLSALHDALGL